MALRTTVSINGSYECVFQDRYHTTSAKLDLGYFIDNNITLSIASSIWNSDTLYYYTPCANGVSCSDMQAPPGQVLQSSSNICYVISKWNGTIEPEYNSHTQTWQFYYSNGGLCGDDSFGEIYINWHCNLAKDGVITYMNQTNGSTCLYEMQVESRWACVLPSESFWTPTNTIYVSIGVVIAVIIICFIIAHKLSVRG
eukprot:357345_1